MVRIDHRKIWTSRNFPAIWYIITIANILQQQHWSQTHLFSLHCRCPSLPWLGIWSPWSWLSETRCCSLGSPGLEARPAPGRSSQESLSQCPGNKSPTGWRNSQQYWSAWGESESIRTCMWMVYTTVLSTCILYCQISIVFRCALIE